MISYRTSILLTFLLIGTFSSLRSGQIEPSFRAKLDRLPPDDVVSSIVTMSERVDLEALNDGLILARATRSERHERVVLALREKAERSQGALLRLLNQSMDEGGVVSFRSFWVTNAIAVEATRDFILRISGRPDVGVIYEDRVTPLIGAVELNEMSGARSDDPPLLAGVEPGIAAMNADSLWRIGITGEGVLVCNLDTGVDGNHPALADRWRGLEPGVSPQEAWFDPFNNSTFPEDSLGHGTASMGCMAGVDPVSGDTIGVAIGATWIAAKISDGNNKTSSGLLRALEWTIDPDGNPYTIDDVPDVVNNSWGDEFADCSTQFWSAIDANRMAGIVMVFSVGNRGPESGSIASPASRVSTSTNTFAVGATGPDDMIADFSGRGPSGCDGVSIKPEVVAHGVAVRTSRRGGDYADYTGTSFASPYVAGGLALLRQMYPVATPTDLFEAVMNTAVDLGDPGEDNDYGHGIPDFAAAADELQSLGEQPWLVLSGSVVDDGNNGKPEAGESFDLIIYLSNLGISAGNVEAQLSLGEPTPFVTIDDDFSAFGDIPQDSTVSNGSDPIRITLDPLTPGAFEMPFLLDLSADGGLYSVQLSITIETPFDIVMGDHDVGNVTFSVSDGGRFGWDTMDQTEGKGFVFPLRGEDQLFDAALVAGYDSVHVSHASRRWPTGPVAADWQMVNGGELLFTTPGVISDQDGLSVCSDVGADYPMGLEVVQRSYAWSDSGRDDFVIVELTFRNIAADTSGDISGFYAGLFTDWNIRPYSRLANNDVGADPSNDIGYMWNDESQIYCGVKVLTDPGLVSFDIIRNLDGSYQFSKAEYWSSLSSGLIDTSSIKKDFSFIVSTGPFDIPDGDSVTVAFAFVGGEGLPDLLSNAAAAGEAYLNLPRVIGMTVTPDDSLFPRGGRLGFTLTAANLTEDSLPVDGWADVRLPNGRLISPIGGPMPFQLGAGDTLNVHLGQQIPSNAPLGGPYTYCVSIGSFPDSTIARDCFEFEVVVPEP